MIYKQMVEDNTVRESQAGRATGGQIHTHPSEVGEGETRRDEHWVLWHFGSRPGCAIKKQ